MAFSRRLVAVSLVAVSLVATFCVAPARAQVTPSTSAGDYMGKLGPIHLLLHLKRNEDGKLAASLDSPDQGANGIPAESVALTGDHLSVAFPTLHASYTADQSMDRMTFTGTWTQGASTPLVLYLQAPFVPAVTPSPIDGDWSGVLAAGSGSLPLLLHIKSDRRGIEFLTFDTPTQHATGLIADHVLFTDRQLAFELPAVQGRYSGRLSADGSTLTGTWTQGAALPLAFTHVIPFAPAAKPSLADGEWTGTVTTPKGNLHTLLHVRSDRTGKEYVTLDSPGQLATGYEATHTALTGRTLRFDVPQLHGSFSGTVSSTELDGTWTQGMSMPVHLTHAHAMPPQAVPAPPAPVALAELAARLDAELKPLVENSALAGTTGIGVAIGVFHQGQRRILTYGAATPASVFEIGSVTKTFTSLLLAQAVASGAVTLNTPLRTLLPPGLVKKPEGPEITLDSLATHHSGLPRLPGNFHPASPLNPYVDYTLDDLYSFLGTNGVGRSPSAPYLYSNVGVALLGQALARNAKLTYEALLERDILLPLHLNHTSLTAPPIPGQTEDDQLTPAWDLAAFAPAGGLRSDVADMLMYTETQLHPPTALAAAIAIQHTLQADAPDGKIALGWHFVSATGDYWHDGATGGFASFAFFNSQHDLAAVVLVNRASALAPSLGQQIAALLEGRAAEPLRR